MPKLIPFRGIDELEGKRIPSQRITPRPRELPLRGHGLVSLEDTMQQSIINDSSDPRIKKAQEYLRRIETYCASPHASIYDTWIERRHGRHTYIELTTKNVNVIRAIRHAVKRLNGKCSVPRLVHGWFEDWTTDERQRHTVVMIRFMY